MTANQHDNRFCGRFSCCQCSVHLKLVVGFDGFIIQQRLFLLLYWLRISVIFPSPAPAGSQEQQQPYTAAGKSCFVVRKL